MSRVVLDELLDRAPYGVVRVANAPAPSNVPRRIGGGGGGGQGAARQQQVEVVELYVEVPSKEVVENAERRSRVWTLLDPAKPGGNKQVLLTLTRSSLAEAVQANAVIVDFLG